MIIILLLCLCFATKNYEVDGYFTGSYDDIDLESQLKVINKPPIKTIQTKFGHIVDCVDINKQYAFDNPLLKNHKIQMKPSFQNTATKVKVHNRSAKSSNIGFRKNLCPKGTVPVRRTTKEDLIRAYNWSSIYFGSLDRVSPGNHFAEVRLTNFDNAFFGISGTLSTYNPPVLQGQMSSAYIFAAHKTSNADVTAVQAGWQVYPELAGDHKTHFFAAWYNKVRRTGCFNGLCPGFVQTSRRIYLGTPVSNTSTYDGPQFEMHLAFVQDPPTGNWWLRAQHMDVGYFPKALFDQKFIYANEGGWSGRTLTTLGALSPPMGSGHFPNGNPKQSCYISRITFKDRDRQDHGPMRSNVAAYSDNRRCYDAVYYDYRDDNLQRVLMLGGPGGNCGN